VSTPAPARAPRAAQPARRGCLWRLTKAGLQLSLLTALFCFTLLYFWLQSDGFQRRILPIIDYLVESQTGEQFSLNRVNVDLWPPAVDLEGVHLWHGATGDTIVSVERVHVPIVLRRGAPIGKLALQAPTVHLHLERDGLREFRDLVRPPPDQRKPLKALPFASLQIRDGSFRLDHPEGTVQLEGLELSPGKGGRGPLRASLRAEVRDLVVSTRLQWPDVQAGGDQIDIPTLSIDTPLLGVDGHARVPLADDLDVDLSAVVRLDELKPLLTPPREAHGRVDLDVAVHGPQTDPEVVLTAMGTELGLDVPGVFTPLLTYELGTITASARASKQGVQLEEAVLHWGGGRIVAQARLTPDQRLEDVHVTGDDVSLEWLLKAFDAAPTPWVDMRTDLEVSASGSLKPLRLEGLFDFAVADLFVGDRPVSAPGVQAMLDIPWARAQGTLLLEKDHIFLAADRVKGPRNRGSCTIDIGFGPRGPLDLAFDLPEADLSDFQPLNGVDMTGHGQVSARIHGPFNALQLEGQGDLSDFSVLGIPYADRLTAIIRSPEMKTLHLDDAEAWVGRSHYTGDFMMDFRPPLAMHTDIVIDEGRVQDMVNMFIDLDGLTGDMEGTLSLHGPLYDMDGEAHMVMSDVGLYGESFPTGEAHGYMDAGRFTLDELRVRRGDEAGITLRGSVEREWALDMEFVADGLTLQTMDRLAEAELPVSGRLTAWSHITNTLFDPSPDGRIALTDVRYGGQPIPDSHLAFDTTDGVAAYTGALVGGHAVVNGTLGLWQEQPYALGIDLRALPAHLFYPTAADGGDVKAVASGHVDIAGHFGPQWSPVDLSMTLPDVMLAWSHHELRNKQPWVYEQKGNRWKVQGLSLQGGQTDLQLSATGGDALLMGGDGTLDLDLLRALLPGVERSAGTADVVLYAVGAKPNVQAVVDVRADAELFRIDAMPVTFEDAVVQARLTKDAFEITELSAGVGGGQLRGAGRIDADQWSPTRYDLEIAVDDAQVQWVDTLPPAIGDARFSFDGPSEALLLNGEVMVHQMEFADRIDWEDWVVSYREEMLVDPATSTADEAMFNLNVHIRADDTIRLRNNVAEGRASADLRIIGDTVRPGLVGRVELFDTIAFLQDREFRVDRGTLIFNDPWSWDPQLDFSLLTEVRSRQQRYNVDYLVFGPFSDWRTSTRSDPPLPQADVNALLWFGVTTDELEQMGELSSAVFQGVADMMLTDFFVSGQAGEFTSELPDLLFDRIDLATGVNARGEYSPEPRLVVEKRLDDLGDLDLSWQINLVRPEDTYMGIDRRIGGIWSLRGWYATLQRDRVLPIGGAYGLDVTARWELD
jgi:hypothetical protein